jgi:hypothetical protein
MSSWVPAINVPCTAAGEASGCIATAEQLLVLPPTNLLSRQRVNLHSRVNDTLLNKCPISAGDAVVEQTDPKRRPILDMSNVKCQPFMTVSNQ